MTNKSVHNKENENTLKFYFKTNVKYTWYACWFQMVSKTNFRNFKTNFSSQFLGMFLIK